MANIDSPFGLWPAKGTGGSTGPRVTEYTVGSGLRIGKGSPLILEADGQVSIMETTAQSVIIGVAAHWVSSTGSGRVVKVFDDPDTIFEIQTDDNNTSTIADAIGANFSILTPAAVNGTTMRSIAEADGSSAAVAGADTNPLRCVATSRNVRRDEFNTSFLGLHVIFNPEMHVYSKGTDTI